MCWMPADALLQRGNVYSLNQNLGAGRQQSMSSISVDAVKRLYEQVQAVNQQREKLSLPKS